MPLPWAFAALLLGDPLSLSFADLLRDEGGRLAPTSKLLAAQGRRVRMTGYVAEMENLPKGGFWLCPMPISADESGGGTADLPPQSVFVVVRSSPGAVFHAPRRPIVVTGLLQIGPETRSDGVMTHLRLLLDREAAKPLPAQRPSVRPKARPAPSASMPKP